MEIEEAVHLVIRVIFGILFAIFVIIFFSEENKKKGKKDE